jgi:NAD(P)H-hydrate epimerase
MAATTTIATANPSGPGDFVLTAKQMRAAEQYLFQHGVDSFALMCAAGEAVAGLIARHWPGREVVVLCGPGNNGGDGFVAAERLRRLGCQVTVLALQPTDRYRGDAARAAALWQGQVLNLNDQNLDAAIPHNALVIDAMFGIGLDRSLNGVAAAAVDRCRDAAARVVAVEIPSGINADTGQVMGAAMMARHTVTFGWPKLGHLLLPGRLHAGSLEVAPLTFDEMSGRAGLAAGGPEARGNGPANWLLNLPRPGALDHKYSRGHALVIGSESMPGAGRLAARAARRIGAGMLTVAAPAGVLPLYMADQPGLIARPLSRLEDLVEILLDSRISAVLVGSGMPPDGATREAVLTALAGGRPVVVDGGGLTAFADRPQELFVLGRPEVVLTPHEGEFARLFPDLGPDQGKVARAQQAAIRSGATIVLKGGDTVIASPRGGVGGAGRILVNREASPFLATAGSGDVLAGLVLGLLAQCMPAFEAAAAAVWFHSEAGFAAGPGLIAEDLPEQIPGISRLIAES